MPKGKRGRKTVRQEPVRLDAPEEEAARAPNLRGALLTEMAASGFDGAHFADMLEVSVKDRIKPVKPPRKNRYVHYCRWAHALLRKEIGPPDAEFGFPPSVLAFIRGLVPGDVKGEIRENAYPVSMEEFCQAMELQNVANS